MDWGLMDNTRNKDYCLLRDEIVYSSPNYYYFAYIEDFIGRTMWASTISLNHIGSIDGDLLTTVTSTVELVRLVLSLFELIIFLYFPNYPLDVSFGTFSVWRMNI